VPGALLRTGNLQELKALGVDGQPVYSAALQLREAIRLKMGREAADCLAIPQPNETGDIIDWYAPMEGDVVPWSAATPEERTEAFRQLNALHEQLRATTASMQAEAQSREKQLFGRLLEKALHFPDPEHLYLVEGKPVVTFWGFASRNAPDNLDPLLALRPPPSPAAAAEPMPAASAFNAAPPPSPEPLAVEAKPRRSWRWLWSLLLLLLLLLLALFLLRACAPTVVLPFGLSQLELPGLPLTEEQQRLHEEAEVRDVLWRSGTTTGLAAGSTGLASEAALPLDKAVTAEANAAALDNLNKDAAALAADKAAQEALAKEALAADKAPKGNEPLNKDQLGKDGNKAPPPELPKTEANAPKPPTAADKKPAPVAPPELNPNAPNAGKPLSIPPELAKGTSTEFLNGSWKAGSGIQDARTGKPMQLDYRFEDGKGQVVVRGSNGLECKGAVNANMQSGQLAISNQGQATCNDGSQYKLPEVVCAPGASSADCTGRYGNQQFPLSMKQGNP